MKKKILSIIVSSSLLILSSCGAVNTNKSVDTAANSSQEVMNESQQSNTNSNNSENSNNATYVDTSRLDKLISDIEYLKKQLDNDLFDDEYDFERRYDTIDDRYERISDRYYIDDDRANTNVKLPLNEFKELENIKTEFENLLKIYKQKYNVH